jgi:hypothetical protein
MRSQNASPENDDSFFNSTATSSSFALCRPKGKNDQFTGGFMNFMYRDNTIFGATKEKHRNIIKLEKLKKIEE